MKTKEIIMPVEVVQFCWKYKIALSIYLIKKNGAQVLNILEIKTFTNLLFYVFLKIN